MAEVSPEVAQQVLEQVATPPQQAATSPIRIETKTGSVFEGQTAEEVFQKLVTSVEHGTTRIRELGDEVQQLRQQQMQQQQPQQGQKTPTDIYWEKWQRDPIEADRYAASMRLGVPEHMVDQVERQTVMQTASMAKNTAVQEFMNRCPDYPDDQQTADLMRRQIAAQFPGQPVTADTMELAFNSLVRAGAVLPIDVQIDEREDQGTIPRVGAGSQLPPMDFERQFRQLSPDQMKKAIEELSARGAR